MPNTNPLEIIQGRLSAAAYIPHPDTCQNYGYSYQHQLQQQMESLTPLIEVDGQLQFLLGNFDKKDAHTIDSTVDFPANGNKTVTYTAHYTW